MVRKECVCGFMCVGDEVVATHIRTKGQKHSFRDFGDSTPWPARIKFRKEVVSALRT